MSRAQLNPKFLAAMNSLAERNREPFREAIGQIIVAAGHKTTSTFSDAQAASLSKTIDRLAAAKVQSASDVVLYFNGDAAEIIFSSSFLMRDIGERLDGITIEKVGAVRAGEHFSVNIEQDGSGAVRENISHRYGGIIEPIAEQRLPEITNAYVAYSVTRLGVSSEPRAFVLNKAEIKRIADAASGGPAVDVFWDVSRSEAAKAAVLLAFANEMGLSHDFHVNAAPIFNSVGNKVSGEGSVLAGVTERPPPPAPPPAPPPPDDDGPSGDDE